MNCEAGWVYDTPTREGWYAIEYCWDSEEGVFPGSSYWDGNDWGGNRPVVACAGPFPNDKDAAVWAEENDSDTLCELERVTMTGRYRRAIKHLGRLESLRGRTTSPGKLEALILSKRNRIVALTPYVVDVRA